MMSMETFVALVEQMRAAQRSYFKHRTSEWLTKSRALEKQVDAAVKAIQQPPQPDLFDQL
jgi:hypothetical protein